MDLSIRRERVAGQNYRWAASAQGFDHPRSGTIDIDTLDAEDHYPDGYIESGFPVGVITATRKLGPYDNSANDGRQVAVGIVIDAHAIGDADVSVSYLVRGDVYNDLLAFPLDSAGIADLGDRFIVYTEEDGS